MIKNLQRKFILITMLSLFLVMTLMVGAINGINLYQMEKQLNGTIKFLSENQGKFPEFKKDDHIKKEPKLGFDLNEETPFATRYFTIELDENGKIETINTGHIAAITSGDAKNYAESVMGSNFTTGYKGIYKYSVTKKENGFLIVFMDCRDKIQTAEKIFFTTLGVAGVTLLLVFVLVSIFSKRAIKPIIVSTEKQKQFITDAGHEIKTPIAIISANADVLELMNGQSEWIVSIRNQISRLDKLVKNLLMLSKMEEDVKLVFADFAVSNTVEEAAGAFETMAEMQGKQFIMEIQPGLTLHGDEASIHQLVSTLADNAVKYSDSSGIIKISLHGIKKGIKLEVYNTTDAIETENLDKLFDRFYRADSSRSRETGGYGIGLSIAKSIVEAHHGKITVKSEDKKSICFTVIISN